MHAVLEEQAKSESNKLPRAGHTLLQATCTIRSSMCRISAGLKGPCWHPKAWEQSTEAFLVCRENTEDAVRARDEDDCDKIPRLLEASMTLPWNSSSPHKSRWDLAYHVKS